ncbi:hypothetical protein K439DRAFT_1624146 [Ramaria rubella]|nr:hypothetical protein K439DRAFT_1624146 [Ramaria rubella]
MSLPASACHSPTWKGCGCDFWLVFIALCSLMFLEALDFTTVSPVLLTIVNELKGNDKLTWISAANTLISTAFQPLTGALADILATAPACCVSLRLEVHCVELHRTWTC